MSQEEAEARLQAVIPISPRTWEPRTYKRMQPTIALYFA